MILALWNKKAIVKLRMMNFQYLMIMIFQLKIPNEYEDE